METVKVKYFTPNEANKTLPLVKSIVKDILMTGQQLNSLKLNNRYSEPSQEYYRMTSLLNSYFDELNEIGCYFKDWNFSIGLVDFPAIIEGEEVFLCWRSDEEKLQYYHKIDEGYSERKLISEEIFSK